MRPSSTTHTHVRWCLVIAIRWGYGWEYAKGMIGVQWSVSCAARLGIVCVWGVLVVVRPKHATTHHHPHAREMVYVYRRSVGVRMGRREKKFGVYWSVSRAARLETVCVVVVSWLL